MSMEIIMGTDMATRSLPMGICPSLFWDEFIVYLLFLWIA